MITSQGQAKRFFVEKIVAQAIADGKPLSEAERYMLSFSESDPEFVVDPAQIDQLAEEISDEEYESKIVGLLERAWTRDMQADSSASNTYREALAVLNQGDHYVQIMIDRALGRRLRR